MLDLNLVVQVMTQIVRLSVSNSKLWLFQNHRRMRSHAARYPNTGAYDAIVSHNRSSAKNRCVSVDHNAVLDGWMPFCATDQLAVRIHRKAQRTERYSLVDFDMISDIASLADYHARSVIDKKGLANGRARVNVNSSLFVRPLRHHAWNEGDSKMNQLVRDTVNGYGL